MKLWKGVSFFWFSHLSQGHKPLKDIESIVWESKNCHLAHYLAMFDSSGRCEYALTSFLPSAPQMLVYSVMPSLFWIQIGHITWKIRPNRGRKAALPCCLKVQAQHCRSPLEIYDFSPKPWPQFGWRPSIFWLSWIQDRLEVLNSRPILTPWTTAMTTGTGRARRQRRWRSWCRGSSRHEFARL